MLKGAETKLPGSSIWIPYYHIFFSLPQFFFPPLKPFLPIYSFFFFLFTSQAFSVSYTLSARPRLRVQKK